MTDQTLSRRTVLFVNIGHALDHFVLLVYPTAVIAIAAELGSTYAELIGLSTGAFVAFGLFSLPMGWIAERISRRNLFAVFFAGCGLACVALSMASTRLQFAGLLLVLGMFTAVYHPIGSAMLVTHARALGRDLGWNGVWGNLGAAFASGVTALIAAWFGWRAAFAVPGIVCLGVCAAFLAAVPGDGDAHDRQKKQTAEISVARPIVMLAVFVLAIVAGGMTFNITTISLPKVIDERIGADLPLALTGSLATAVFVFGALTQLFVGQLVDRISLPTVFVGLALFQPVGLALAAASTGLPMLAGLVFVMAAIYGQVVVNDAMVARYVPPRLRAKAFSLRYFLGFTTSGAAVPLIAWLHGEGGFALVLMAASAFGTAIFAAACAFWLAAQARPRAAAAGE